MSRKKFEDLARTAWRIGVNNATTEEEKREFQLLLDRLDGKAPLDPDRFKHKEF